MVMFDSLDLEMLWRGDNGDICGVLGDTGLRGGTSAILKIDSLHTSYIVLYAVKHWESEI